MLIRRFYELFPDEGATRALDEPFVLTGADLHRLNCQSCHGPDGSGSPPEINSLRGPVQGTSPSLILRRMRERDQPIDAEYARELAAQADKHFVTDSSTEARRCPRSPTSKERRWKRSSAISNGSWEHRRRRARISA